MPRRKAPKPDSATETARVLRVFDMLVSELDARYPPVAVVTTGPPTIHPSDALPRLLEVADRIAARTEDPA
jgi:hypothetical protein